MAGERSDLAGHHPLRAHPGQAGAAQVIRATRLSHTGADTGAGQIAADIAPRLEEQLVAGTVLEGKLDQISLPLKDQRHAAIAGLSLRAANMHRGMVRIGVTTSCSVGRALLGAGAHHQGHARTAVRRELRDDPLHLVAGVPALARLIVGCEGHRQHGVDVSGPESIALDHLQRAAQADQLLGDGVVADAAPRIDELAGVVALGRHSPLCPALGDVLVDQTRAMRRLERGELERDVLTGGVVLEDADQVPSLGDEELDGALALPRRRRAGKRLEFLAALLDRVAQRRSRRGCGTWIGGLALPSVPDDTSRGPVAAPGGAVAPVSFLAIPVAAVPDAAVLGLIEAVVWH